MRIVVLLLSFLLFQEVIAKKTGDKVLIVILENTGIVKIGRDTVAVDNIAKYVQERLFKSFLGTGKMHDRILFAKEKGMEDEMAVQVVIKEIKEGQNRALRQICAEKFRKQYDDLDQGRQKKLQKQFPVLFQTDYLSKAQS